MRYNDILTDDTLEPYVRQFNQRAKGLGHASITLSAIRDRILECRGQCEWCGEILIGAEFELDHIQSLHRGGAHDPDNLVVACQVCNRRKSTKSPIQYALEIVAEKGIKTRFVQVLLDKHTTDAPTQRSLFDDDDSIPPNPSTHYHW